MKPSPCIFIKFFIIKIHESFTYFKNNIAFFALIAAQIQETSLQDAPSGRETAQSPTHKDKSSKATRLRVKQSG